MTFRVSKQSQDKTPPPRLTEIHLARKPLDGTVASTVLKWGTGALNIDGTRLACGTDHFRGDWIKGPTRVGMTPGDGRQGGSLGMFEPGRGFQPTNHTVGRWPANLILQHLQHVWYRLREDVPEVLRVQIHSHYGFDEALPTLPGRDSGDAFGTPETEVLLQEVRSGVLGRSQQREAESGVGDPHLPALPEPLRGNPSLGAEWSQEVVLEAVPRSGEPPDQAFGEGPYGRVSGENGGGGHMEAPDEQLLAVAGRQVQEQRVHPGDGGPVDSGTAGAGPADAHREAESAVHTGASASSRSDPGACSIAERGGSSSERSEGRQSVGEPGGSSSGRPLDAASGSRAGTSVVAGASASVDPGEHFLEVEAGDIPPGWQPYFAQHRVEGCEKVGEHYSFFAECEEARGAVEENKTGQMVEDWNCVEGCPCKDIDEQSGTTSGTGGSTSGGSAFGQNLGWNQHNNRSTTISRQNDEGGASRYFKQVQSEQDLWSYLNAMISGPTLPGLYCTRSGDALDTWLAEFENNAVPGVILNSKVTRTQAEGLMRVLMPGGHICLIAPDTQPTGHTGACLLEDAGFEIRDAILWVRGAGRTHYVAKAARQEREAGCQQLPAKKGHEAVDRKEGSAGVQNPRAGAGRTASEVRNFHPTVKPIAVMDRLLADVPKGIGPVLDPFLGSGTTMIACLRSGHDGIGIERQEEYLRIAETRVRHWDRAGQGWLGANIQSDLKNEEVTKAEPLDLFDLFD